MKVEVWADVLCPWSYLGKRRLESALVLHGDADAIDVEWRSWELDSELPIEPALMTVERMVRSGRPRAAVLERFAHIVSLGRAEGLELNLQTARPANSFDAHRLLVHAEGRGLRGALMERLLHAYHTENRNLADHGVLAGAAHETGLDREAATAVLASGEHGDEVRSEQRRGAALGVAGVPTFVVDGVAAPPGALPADTLAGLFAARC